MHKPNQLQSDCYGTSEKQRKLATSRSDNSGHSRTPEARFHVFESASPFGIHPRPCSSSLSRNGRLGMNSDRPYPRIQPLPSADFGPTHTGDVLAPLTSINRDGRAQRENPPPDDGLSIRHSTATPNPKTFFSSDLLQLSRGYNRTNRKQERNHQ